MYEEINLNSTSVSSDFNNLPCLSIENSVDRKEYFRLYRQKQCKTPNLEKIISTLPSPHKRAVIHNVSRNLDEIVAFTDSSSIFEAIANFLSEKFMETGLFHRIPKTFRRAVFRACKLELSKIDTLDTKY